MFSKPEVASSQESHTGHLQDDLARRTYLGTELLQYWKLHVDRVQEENAMLSASDNQFLRARWWFFCLLLFDALIMSGEFPFCRDHRRLL
jgi:hypothetical protein